MPSELVEIRTREGDCGCYVMTPAGSGPWPGIIFFMDAGGIRPAVVEMARRLANDASYPPDMAARFEAALLHFGLRYAAETYPALHGWMKPDFPVYNHALAERGWAAMLAFFGRSLVGVRAAAGGAAADGEQAGR